MPTRDELEKQLEDQRESLEKPYAAAVARGDKAEQQKLEDLAKQIDLTLDQIALLDLSDLADRLAEYREKIESLTAEAKAWPFATSDTAGDDEGLAPGEVVDNADTDADVKPDQPAPAAAPAPSQPPTPAPASPPAHPSPPAGGGPLTLSPKGAALIKAFESCEKKVAGGFKAYRDAIGKLTIGWGHTNDHGRQFDADSVWSQQECDAEFQNDMVRFEAAVHRLVKVPLNQDQFDALVSFAYNCGEGNLEQSTLLKKLNAGDYDGAAKEFQRWNKAGGKVLRGLVRRRASEALLFQGIPDSNYDGIPD